MAKPISLSASVASLAGGNDPEPFVIVGAPVAPAVDTTPADATAVATDLDALRTALIAAGVLRAS